MERKRGRLSMKSAKVPTRYRSSRSRSTYRTAICTPLVLALVPVIPTEVGIAKGSTRFAMSVLDRRYKMSAAEIGSTTKAGIAYGTSLVPPYSTSVPRSRSLVPGRLVASA
eukprot:2323207-Rhodomonas_salina.2